MYTDTVAGRGGIYAKLVADSISPVGIRLTTMELHYPRFIHSEVMTHRLFSRNSSSSRAIPTEKMIAAVAASPAIPIHWGKNQPGMQAREELPHQWVKHPHIGEECNYVDYWKESAESAIQCAEGLLEVGMHKQVSNRLLEPFQFIKVIVTATEWDNFFKLRLHEDAQPEIAELALCMKELMLGNVPKELQPGEWHLPYVDLYDYNYITNLGYEDEEEYTCIVEARKCSAARCARVSYNNHDNTSPNIEKDIKLADKLLEAGHMSCFEHQATPLDVELQEDEFEEDKFFIKGITHLDRNGDFWSNNFRGFIQYRALL